MNTNIEKVLAEVNRQWGPLNSGLVRLCRERMEELAQSGMVPGLAGEESLELLRDPGHGYVLTAYSERKGRYREAHDHGSGWVIYAVVSGEMEMGTYARSVSQRGEMSLVRRNSTRMGPGAVEVYLPGDIHDTLCISDTVVLRLTSCDLKKEDSEGRMIRYLEDCDR